MLDGELPSHLGTLSKLRYLQLAHNSLAGPIPLSYGNLSSLEYIMVLENNLTGPIPHTLGSLRNLQTLSLAVNNLVGGIPSSIFNISSMLFFDVGENQLVGRFLFNLGFAFPKLQFLGISFNHFTGTIPPSISNVSTLTVISSSQNDFNGRVPSFQKMKELRWLGLAANHLGSGKSHDLDFFCSLTNSTKLEVLDVGSNNFGGELPECLANMSSTLTALTLDYNTISGSLSSGIGNLVNLEALLMFSNNISGKIPSEIGNLKQLKELNLGSNAFSGQIPVTFANFTMMTELALFNNSLEGNIPSCLSNFRNLIWLDLSENRLQGVIPREIMSLTSLSIVADFSRNHFSGQMPQEVGNLRNLERLFVAGNNFSGEIPTTIGSCTELESLHLQDNQFRGSIPLTLRFLKGIQHLNLSNNRLSGQIPHFLELLPLKNLDLSFNEFEGPLPTGGIFSNVSTTMIIGNMKLCGGLPEFKLPKCNDAGRSRKRRGSHKKVIIVTVCGLAGLTAFVLFSGIYFFWYRKERKEAASIDPNNGLLKVSYQSLLKASNGFASSNLIGVGSFGSVYKALLDGDGGRTVVAIKVLNLDNRRASKSFVSECKALRNIRHRNLVKVLTACSGSDYQGNDFKALVYEYISSGSLDEWLHPAAVEAAEETPKRLGFLQRLNIAIDVASALDYLHHQCEEPIVHCDLKPNNVLLDDEMTARVGDFGLVRFAPQAARDIIAERTSSIGVKGSFGYIAPEYAAGLEVSTKGDAYSYGILLLEMFTGKRPTDEMFQDGLSLHAFAKAALPEQVCEIADPLLAQECHGSDDARRYMTTEQRNNRFRKFQECLEPIVEIGVICSSESPRERENIRSVLSVLHKVKRKLIEAERTMSGIEQL